MLSFYESGKEDVPEDVLKVLVKALKVGPDEVKFFSELRDEDAVPYRTRSIPLEIINDEMLQAARRDFAKRLDNANGREFDLLHAAIGEIAAEQQRRAQQPDEVILHRQGKPKPVGPGGLSSEQVSEAAASSKASLERMGVIEPASSEGSKRSPEADEKHPHKGQPARSSSGETKTPRPAHEGKGQK